jgi:hypothetical protein
MSASETWRSKKSGTEMTPDEIYFASKDAFKTLEGEAIKKRLAEIYTPEVQKRMDEKEKTMTHLSVEEIAQKLDPEDTDKLRRELNKDYAKQRRDKSRKNDYSPRSTRAAKQ